jgi:hypothetical protein
MKNELKQKRTEFIKLAIDNPIKAAKELNILAARLRVAKSDKTRLKIIEKAVFVSERIAIESMKKAAD